MGNQKEQADKGIESVGTNPNLQLKTCIYVGQHVCAETYL